LMYLLYHRLGKMSSKDYIKLPCSTLVHKCATVITFIPVFATSSACTGRLYCPEMPFAAARAIAIVPSVFIIGIITEYQEDNQNEGKNTRSSYCYDRFSSPASNHIKSFSHCCSLAFYSYYTIGLDFCQSLTVITSVVLQIQVTSLL
jgi:hypothetical protein